MTFREYIIVFILWIFFFILYSIFLWNDISVHHLLIISFVAMAVVKSIYDVINKTGNEKMYVYSDKTNQRLRYLSASISIGVTIFYHYALFCKMLDYCAN